MSKLILAEKPMLARAIADAIPGKGIQKNGYTVKGEYTIVAAFGHLLTLKEPEDYDADRYRRWSLSQLPIYFENWGQKPGKGKQERLELIGSLLKEAECVIHAGDPDDEGQYLIDEILRWFDYRGQVLRLATGDTTESALAKALANMKDNNDYVNAGWSAHARSVADIMVGFNFSRYFSLLNPHVKMLTVGRVQTPTLGLVVMRDMAIENHSKQAYYTITAELELQQGHVTATFEPSKDNPNLTDGRLTDGAYAEALVKAMKGAILRDTSVTRKSIIEPPPLPFNLVKLQSYCSARFGYDPSQTLAITQTLRDNHNAITYNRSDCRYLSEEQYKQSAATVQQVLKNLQGTAAESVFRKLPLDTSLHSKAFDDKNITAHTAIIPQNRRVDLSRLTEEERNVYLAITKYYMAQFLPPAEKERTALEAPIEGGVLKAFSTKVIKPGYLRLIRPEKKAEGDESEGESENELSAMETGSWEAHCIDARAEGKETKAPPRYTKATLNEDMTRIAKYVTDPRAKELLLAKDKEKKGENGSIGTSATRSGIIDNLEARGFLVSKGKKIMSTELGRELYRILPDQLKKPDMTGLWWAYQESIREGSKPWTDLTDSVLEMVRQVVGTAYPKVDAFHVPEEMRRGRLPLGACPRCGADVIEGQKDYGCSNYRSGCRFLIKKTSERGMMSKNEVSAEQVHTWLEQGWIQEERPDENGTLQKTGRRRSRAAIDMKKLYSEQKGKTYSGSVYLTDDGSDYGAGFGLENLIKEAPLVLGKCPRCGMDVVEGQRGFGCSGWKNGCRFVIWKQSKMKLLANVTFTKTDAKKFLSGKAVKKKRLSDKKGLLFTAELIMEESPDNPFGPVFRVVEGSIEVPAGSPEDIQTPLVPAP